MVVLGTTIHEFACNASSSERVDELKSHYNRSVS